jgi:outer membrane immunogenic protein
LAAAGVGLVMRNWTATGVFAACALVASISSASAQSARPAIWQGFYAGAHGGYGNGLDKSHAANGLTLQNNLDGGFVGGQAGYNFRSGDWVFGPEISASKTMFSGSTTCINSAFTCNLDAKLLMHANARLGFAAGSALIYGTAGLSTGKLDDTAIYIGANPASAGLRFSASERHTGWNAGFGVDYAMSSTWSVGLEYRHVSLKEVDHAAKSNLNGQVTTAAHTPRADLISARLNYHFGQ